MTISMPASPGFRRSRFVVENNTQTFQSPLTNTTQTLLLAGARWVASYTLPKMKANGTDAANWEAFFLQLEGRAGTFYGYHPDRKNPRGPATGTPLVNGGSQTGSSLTIDGCTANVTGWMRAGDFFAVNGELKQLTADANSNGSGQATLSFKPALRTSPADNAPLTVRGATCVMMLTDDAQGMGESDENGVYDEITFTAVEQLT